MSGWDGQIELLDFGPRSRPVVSGEVLMAFEPGIDPDRVETLLADYGLALRTLSPRTGAARVALPEGWSVTRGLASLRGLEGLPNPEPNALVWASGNSKTKKRRRRPSESEVAEVPPDPVAEPAPAEPVDEPAYGSFEAMQAAIYAPRQQSNLSVDDMPIVAVIDTGVAYTDRRLEGCWKHPGLDSYHFVDGWDFVNNDALACDDHQHGTHVAATIANAAKIDARIMPIKILDEYAIGYEYNVAEGIIFAVDAGARVINLSLSFGPVYVPSSLMATALDRAAAAGTAVVAASGNDGAQMVSFPAAIRSVLAVGAYQSRSPDAVEGHDWSVPAYSNRGSALDCVAEGGGVDVWNSGVEAPTIALRQPSQFITARMSGTSMASAGAAGIVAQAAHLGANITPTQFKAIFLGGARAGDDFSPEWGVGRLHSTFQPHSVTESFDSIHQGLTFANPGVVLESAEDGHRLRAVALVEVVDPAQQPISDAVVHADWLGSVNAVATCVTDVLGRCVVETDWLDMASGDPVMFAFRVNRLQWSDGCLSQPLTGYRLGESRAVELQSMLEVDPVDSGLTPTGSVAPQVVTRFEAAEPDGNSLLAGRQLDRTYLIKSLSTAQTGGSLVLAFNDAYWSQLGAEHLIELEDGLRLVCSGDGDALLWINDCTEDVLSEGAGLIASGQTGGSLSAWAFNQLYSPALAVGSGLIASGWSIDQLSLIVESFSTFFAQGSGLIASGWISGKDSLRLFDAFNRLLAGDAWNTYGAGLIASGFSPFRFFNYPYIVEL